MRETENEDDLKSCVIVDLDEGELTTFTPCKSLQSKANINESDTKEYANHRCNFVIAHSHKEKL
jgi:hypothetical protein